MEEQKNYFSICFNVMKLRYVEFDRAIDELSFLYPNDKINVFINFESILRRICTIRDLESKILTTPKFPTIMMSDMLNIAAHYKRFFVGNNLRTRVFLYMTDWGSDEFKEYDRNDDYRSYYLMKYNKNPKYDAMREDFVETIFPQIKTIFEFIPDVYFITTKNIDASVVPYVIGEMDKNYKNFIIGSDIFDTQYTFYPNYASFCLKRGQTNPSTTYTLKGYLEKLFKLRLTETNTLQYLNLYSNRSFYLSLLGSVGEHYRSIDRVGDLTPLKNTKMLVNGLETGKITSTTESLKILSDAYPEDYCSEMESALYQFDIENKYRLLTKEDMFHITSQIVDRFDHNALMTLNQTQFHEFPLMLEELTGQANV